MGWLRVGDHKTSSMPRVMQKLGPLCGTIVGVRCSNVDSDVVINVHGGVLPMRHDGRLYRQLVASDHDPVAQGLSALSR